MVAQPQDTPILADTNEPVPTGPIPGGSGFNFVTDSTGGFGGVTANTGGGPAPSVVISPSSSSIITTTTTITAGTVTGSATATVTNTPAPTSNPIPLNIVLPAVIAPVAVLFIAVPLIIFFIWRHRTKKLEREQRRMSTPDPFGSSTGGHLLNKESQSFKPFSDGEKNLNHSDTHSSLGHEDGMGEAIALNARNRGWSSEENGLRNPNPQFPMTGVTKRPQRPERPKERPTTGNAWPLPAHSPLPSPGPGAEKPLPKTSASDSPSLPPMQFNEFNFHDSLGTDSSLYDLSSTAKNFPDPPVAGSSAIHKKRESDLVSELSDHEEVRPSARRRDTDNISVISAMTSRSQSQRRKSSASAVSALAPEDQPQIPTQPLPRR